MKKTRGMREKEEELIEKAKDFLTAIETWNGREMKYGVIGHEIVKMRPILLAKSICESIINN